MKQLGIFKNNEDEVFVCRIEDDLYIKDDVVRVDDDEWNQVAKDNAYDDGTLDDYSSDIVDEEVRTITFMEALEDGHIRLPHITMVDEEEIIPLYDILYEKVPQDYQLPFDMFKKRLLQENIVVIDDEIIAMRDGE